MLTRDAGDRALRARLEYTRAQRGVGALTVRAEGHRVLSSFPYEVCGIKTGLHEGVLLGCEEDPSPNWLDGVVEETGAALFKLTRVAPLPHSEQEPQRTRRWTIVRRAMAARDVLCLAPTYDKMVAGLGRHTRRNIRAARKLAVAERFEFEVSTDAPLLSGAAWAEFASNNQPPGKPVALMDRLEAYANLTGRPFRTIVRAANGDVVSYCCGYFGDSSTAYLLYQLNNPAMNAIGPSLLHRAFLIEWVLHLGCTELVFVHGCSGILHYACVQQHLEELWLMRRSVTAFVGAATIGLLKPKASLGQLARLALASEVQHRLRHIGGKSQLDGSQAHL